MLNIQNPGANHAPVTIYNLASTATDEFVYKRIILTRSHLMTGSDARDEFTGREVQIDGRLLVFDLEGFVPFIEYSGSGWTLNPGTPERRHSSIVIPGHHPFDFDKGTLADLDIQVKQLVRTRTIEIFRCDGVNVRKHGSPRMWHVSAELRRAV